MPIIPSLMKVPCDFLVPGSRDFYILSSLKWIEQIYQQKKFQNNITTSVTEIAIIFNFTVYVQSFIASIKVQTIVI